MLSFDTNILFAAINKEHASHDKAACFFQGLEERRDVLVSEFVLVELYNLLRNPLLMKKDLSPGEATDVVQHVRHHHRWLLSDFPPSGRLVHEELWRQTAVPGFARRRVYDSRLALSLHQVGVREFATANPKDFQGFGFARVWNPLVDSTPTP